MTVKIGISPIAWQNDDLPDLTKDFTMEQALKESRDIGYTGVERGQRMPNDTDGLRSFLEKYDIGLCGGWCSGNLLNNSAPEECNAVQQQVDQFIALNAPCIVFAECSNTVQGMIDVPVNDRPQLTRDEIKAYAEKLTEVAKWMQDRGMPMAKDIRPEIVKDVRENNRSFLDAVIAGAFTVPGDGCIDFLSVAQKLKAADYNGWIVVEAEQDPAKAPPYEYSQKGYQNILDVCATAGLEITNET